jgi:hypothetical protein
MRVAPMQQSGQKWRKRTPSGPVAASMNAASFGHWCGDKPHRSMGGSGIVGHLGKKKDPGFSSSGSGNLSSGS